MMTWATLLMKHPVMTVRGDFSSDTEDEDEQEEEIELNSVWCDIPFTGVNEMKYPFAADATPIDYFNVLVDLIFIENIVKVTNRYVEETCNSDSSPRSRISKFKELTVDELKIFIGLILHTGTIHLNRVQDYWKTHRLFNIECYRKYMSRDRFLAILRFLHFSNNALNTEDRLHKV